MQATLANENAVWIPQSCRILYAGGNLIPHLLMPVPGGFFIPRPAGEMQGVKGRGYAALTMNFLTSDSFSFFNHSLF